jgi:hypothetical protein
VAEHELGAVYVSVIPSLAGANAIMAEGATAAARIFTETFRAQTAGKLFPHDEVARFTASMGSAGREAGQAFENGVVPHLDRVRSGLHGNTLAAGAMGGAIVEAGQLATEAFHGIIEAGEEVAHKLIEIGETFENIQRQIIVKAPGISGAFTDMMGDIKAVAAQTSASLTDVGDAATGLGLRLKGALNDSQLRDVVLDVVDAQKMLGQKVDTSAFVASMHALNIPLQQADSWFNQLFNISRATGVPLNELVKTLQQNGAALHEFNIPAGAAAALMAEMSEHGISTQKSMRGLMAAGKEAAKEGKSLPDFLKDTIAQMEHFRDVGNKVAELKIAERAFGPRAALDFLNAINQGVVSLDALSQAFDAPTDKASDLYRKTETLSDRFGELKNQATIALSDIATSLNEHLGDGLKEVGEWVKTHGATIIGWLETFGDIGLYVSGELVKGFGELSTIFGGIGRMVGTLTGDNALQQFGQQLLDIGDAAGDAGQHIIGSIPDFNRFMESAKKGQETVDLLNQALEKTSDGKGLKIKDNSADVIERLKKLGVVVSQTPDGKLTITADTPDNANRIKEWIKSQTGQDLDVKVVPKPQTPDGKPYDGDPKSLFPGAADGIHIPMTLDPPKSDHHRDDQPWWNNPPWGPIWPGFTPGNPFGIHPQTPAPQQPQMPYAPGTPVPAPHGIRPKPGEIAPPGWPGLIPGQIVPPGYQHGGGVPGVGSGDTVPSMLEPGEFVAPTWMAKTYGPMLEAIRIRGFHGGGFVGDSPFPFPTVPMPGPGNVPGAPIISTQQKAAEDYAEKQTEAARAVERVKDRIEDLTNTIDDDNAKIKDLNTQLQDETLTDEDRAKLTKELNRTQQSLNRTIRDRNEAEQDLTTAQRKQTEATQQTPQTGGKGGETGTTGEQMGKGIVKGIFQELGFPDVFNKSPSEWGISKLLMGLLGFGLNVGNVWEGRAEAGQGGPLAGLQLPGSTRLPDAPHAGTGARPGPTGALTFGGVPAVIPGTPNFYGPPVHGGQPPDPLPGPLPSSPPAPGKAGTAAYIVQQARARGFSPEQTQAILSTGLQESGLDETAKGGNGLWHGIFQQDSSYPNRDDTAGNINAFFDRLGPPSGDIWSQIFGLQQGTPYSSPGARKGYMDEIKSQLAEAQNLYSQVTGGGGGAPTPAQLAAFTTTAPSPPGGFGAAVGNPTVPPPDENTIRTWVEQHFGIKNSFGSGSWENRAHEYDGGWHHRGLGGATVPSGYGFDFHGSPEQMDNLANWIANNDLQNTLELIHQGPGFDTSREIKNAKFGDVYGPALDAEHRDHVHWAVTALPDAMRMMDPAAPGLPQPPSSGAISQLPRPPQPTQPAAGGPWAALGALGRNLMTTTAGLRTPDPATTVPQLHEQWTTGARQDRGYYTGNPLFDRDSKAWQEQNAYWLSGQADQWFDHLGPVGSGGLPGFANAALTAGLSAFGGGQGGALAQAVTQAFGGGGASGQFGSGGSAPPSPSATAGLMQNLGGQQTTAVSPNTGPTFIQNNSGITTDAQLGKSVAKTVQSMSTNPGAYSGSVYSQG